MSYTDDGSLSGEEDIFMKRFKFYKRKKPPPDFSDVIDFETISEDVATVSGEKVVRVRLSEASVGSIDGMRDVADWKAYRIERLPGVTFIQNPFLPVYQRYWVCRCLAAYPLRPNVCNLDGDQHVDRGNTGDLWQQAHVHDPDVVLSKKDLLNKLRWVTLGYHYDWTKKVYASSRWSSFPTDLADLSRCLASLLGYHSYTAEAAIVNYYHSDSTLAGHVDHSEFDKRAPLLSISFGQSAVFMVGGNTRQIEPAAMLLRSGDIVVLADESRLAYHAVPRILSSNKPLRCMLKLTDSVDTNNPQSHDDAIRKPAECNGKNDCECIVETQVMSKRARMNGDALKHVETLSCVSIEATSTHAAFVHAKQVNSSTTTLTKCANEAKTAPNIGQIGYCSLTVSQVKDEEYWRPFESYVQCRRININIRQVAVPGTNVKDLC